MKNILFLIFTLTMFISLQAETLKDDFTEIKKDGRSLLRGEWKLENNVAFCKADPELYKKYANHGPIIRYSKEFKDISVEFEMKAVDCQRVVFTLNGEGHIFRVSIMEGSEGKNYLASRIIAWATQSSKENKGDTVKPDGFPNLADINNKWVKVKLDVKGNSGTLKIGDFTHTLEHASLARDKKEVTLSFATGDLSMRNFEMTTSK